MAGDTDIRQEQNNSSLLTPSKLNFNQINNSENNLTLKRKHENEDIDVIFNQLQREKQNNDLLKNELSEMRVQLSALTNTISSLNDTINKLQKHNEKLYKQMQNKNSKKNQKKKRETRSKR